MDDENNFIVDKSRCFDLTGKVLSKPGEKEFAVFRDWLAGDARPQEPAPQRTPTQNEPTQNTKHNTDAGAARQRATQTNANNTLPQRPFRVVANRINCFALNVEPRTSKTSVPFLVLKMNGQYNGQQLAFCWHASLFDALTSSSGKQVQFEFDLGKDNKTINIMDVLDIDGQSYRDGKPWHDNLDADDLFGEQSKSTSQPVAAGGAFLDGTEITDDDIPF
jgi:hypothetical protein